MKQPNYRIYPSVLDKFQKFLDSDMESEDFWNIDRETGEQKKSADEIARIHEQELLDMINRVKKDPIEPADKGTCFNEIIDCLIEFRKPDPKTGIEIRSVYEEPIQKAKDALQPITGDATFVGENKPKPVAIEAKLNGFKFLFDIQLCKEVAEYFTGSLCQYLAKGELETQYGTVELYGYIDEWVKDKIFDIKTTSSYDFGKFERSWQKEVYPYCVIQSGQAETVSEFEYTVVKLSGGSTRNPIISGTVYRECYTYNHDKTTVKLRNHVERFIEWLESHRNVITNKKIFGGE